MINVISLSRDINPCLNINNKSKEKNITVNNLLRNDKIPLATLMSVYAPLSFRGTNLPKNIADLNIPNVHLINQNCIRGESLSHKKNKHLISEVKKCGIEQIIDLKTADFNDRFEHKVKRNGMDYHHYPIDSSVTPTREIIDNLPSFFSQMNKGHYYIACAQGMHRTDIAMSINYVFNPKSTGEPPVLYGHKTDKGLRFDDIAKRLNSIFKELTNEDKIKLGLEDFDEQVFKAKKKSLISANS